MTNIYIDAYKCKGNWFPVLSFKCHLQQSWNDLISTTNSQKVYQNLPKKISWYDKELSHVMISSPCIDKEKANELNLIMEQWKEKSTHEGNSVHPLRSISEIKVIFSPIILSAKKNPLLPLWDGTVNSDEQWLFLGVWLAMLTQLAASKLVSHSLCAKTTVPAMLNLAHLHINY